MQNKKKVILVQMRKIKSVFSLIKMRRNVKFILIFSISSMFILLYMQGSGNKVISRDFECCKNKYQTSNLYAWQRKCKIRFEV